MRITPSASRTVPDAARRSTSCFTSLMAPLTSMAGRSAGRWGMPLPTGPSSFANSMTMGYSSTRSRGISVRRTPSRRTACVSYTMVTPSACSYTSRTSSLERSALLEAELRAPSRDFSCG